MGRAGRGGEPSICVFLHLKNQRLPKEMRPFFKADSAFCQRRALTQIFTLHDTDGDMSCISFGVMRFPLYFFISVVYATEEARVGCSEACLDQGRCACSKCKYILYRLLSTVLYLMLLQLLHQLYCYLYLLSVGHQTRCWPAGEGHPRFRRSRVRVSTLYWVFPSK